MCGIYDATLAIGDRVVVSNDDPNRDYSFLRKTVGTLVDLSEVRDCGSPLAKVEWDGEEGAQHIDAAWLKKAPIDPFFFIWNPAAPMPPRVKFRIYDDAVDAAKRLAKNNPGEEFFVAEARALVKVEIPEPSVTKVG